MSQLSDSDQELERNEEIEEKPEEVVVEEVVEEIKEKRKRTMSDATKLKLKEGKALAKLKRDAIKLEIKEAKPKRFANEATKIALAKGREKMHEKRNAKHAEKLEEKLAIVKQKLPKKEKVEEEETPKLIGLPKPRNIPVDKPSIKFRFV